MYVRYSNDRSYRIYSQSKNNSQKFKTEFFSTRKKYKKSSKQYWRKNAHIKFSEGKKIVGSAKFLSINALNGYELSRRDDLESIVYIIIYFLKGCLPWQGIKLNNKEEKYKKVYTIKNDITPKYLCKDLPEEFEAFVEYVKKLEFTDVPNYNYLKDLLKKVIEK